MEKLDFIKKMKQLLQTPNFEAIKQIYILNAVFGLKAQERVLKKKKVSEN